MFSYQDSTGRPLVALSSRQLQYCIDLPNDDPQWKGCPWDIDAVKEQMRCELAARAKGATFANG